VLWFAETLSVFGDRFFTLALTWTAWQRSGAVAMGLVTLVEYVPHILVGTFGKRLVARFASFRALAVVEIAQVAVVGSVPWLWESIGLAGVLAVLALIGTADAVTNPSLSSLAPDLVPADLVRQITALMDLTGRLTWVLGPGTAAVLLVWMQPEHLFWIDAGTFLVSASAFVWLARHQRRRHADKPAETSDPPQGAARAREVLRARPHLTCGLSLATVGEFAATVATFGLPIWLTSRLHAGPAAYGMVLTAMGAGSLAGNLLTALRLPFPAGYCLTWAARGAFLASYAATTEVWQVVAVTAVAGALTPLTSVALDTEISRLSGPERLRMFSIELTGLHIAGMSSMLALPALIAAAPGISFAAAGALTVGAGMLAWGLAGALERRRQLRAETAFART
jgi:hypothetical protein